MGHWATHRGGRPRALRPTRVPDRSGEVTVHDASAVELSLWVGLPYLALGIFVVGHIWRWRYDQFGWTSRSTQLQEHRLLKWGSPVFHYATFAAIVGHVMGILIPESMTRALGISESVYRWFAAIAGAVAAVLVLIGIAILAWRRLFVPRVRATTALVDYVVLILLLVVVLDGTVVTIGDHLLGSGHHYRQTVAPWFRSLFVFQPDVAAISSATFTYQLHAVIAWPILMLWPFSRLVHAWSYPLWFLWRPYIVYRSKQAARPTEPGTSGRRWRKIGVRY
ncbi:MAG: respiratory nitrate reductase subunit gamma [Pseudonocardiaceae bacterium]|nr:respiratory nitrate reductase subunit gamma [Pseudonocardiaceae bacterium]